jgi:hypothetical protein
MQKNEIRAGMDIVKMQIQSSIAFVFAILLVAVREKTMVEVYAGLLILTLAFMTLWTRKYKYLGRTLDKLEGRKNE